MSARLPFRPHLENLEQRDCPTVNIMIDAAGNFALSGIPDGPIELQMTADNAFDVTDNGVPVGSFTAIANVSITTLGGLDDEITLFMDDGFGAYSLSGNLTINTGVGSDSISIESNFFGSSIDGNINIYGGNNFFLNSFGFDPIFVGGNITINDQTEQEIGRYEFLANIGGNLSILGTPALPVIGNDVQLFFGSTIGNDFFARFGNGNNTFTFDFETYIGRNMTILTGSGDDFVSFSGFAGGNLYYNAGSAITGNTLNLEGFLAGNLTMLSQGFFDDFVFWTGQVGGNAYFNLGSSGLLGDVVDMFASAGLYGSSFTYLGGVGSDFVNLDGEFNHTRVYASLGAGDDEFVMFSPLNLSYLYVDFGIGNDSFGPPPGEIFTYYVYLRNLA